MKKIIKLVVVLSLLSIIILGYTFFINKDNPLPREVTDTEIIDAYNYLNESLVQKRNPYLKFIENNEIKYGNSFYKSSLLNPILDDEINYHSNYTKVIEDNIAEYVVNVDEAGLYQIEVDYLIKGNILSNLTIALNINGNFQFDESKTIDVPLHWKDDSKEFLTDSYGDESLPPQTKIENWQKLYLYNNTYDTVMPLLFWFDKGENVISIENSSSGDLFLGDLKLVSPKELSTYDEYINNYDSNENKSKVFINAITYSSKNSSFIRMNSFKSPTVTPFDPVYKKINIIDGLSWKQSGQEITYDIEIEKDGLYEIAFHYMNEKNDYSVFRTIKIDGEIPFYEMSAYEFPTTGTGTWDNLTLNRDNEPYKFYFEKGTHTISFRAEKEPISKNYITMQLLIDHVNQFALDVRKIVGNDVDENRTWRFTDDIKETEAYLESYEVLIIGLIQDMSKYAPNGHMSSTLSSLKKALAKVEKIQEKPDELPLYLEDLFKFDSQSNNVTITQMLGDTMKTISEQPLYLNGFYIMNNETLDKPNAKITKKLSSSVSSFISTFTTNKYVVKKDPEALNIWVNRPITHIDLMQKLVDSEFTPKTGIKVKISVMPDQNKLVLANAANESPDLALGLQAHIPFDLAIRGAAYDISQFDDFWQFADNFAPGAFVPYILNDGVYAIPETLDFHATVYRKDVFRSLDLEVPDTWDDVIDTLPTLQRYGMNFYHPIAGGIALKWFYQTSPMIYQYNGTLYNADGITTAINSPNSYAGLKMLGELYTLYSLPEQVPIFYNSFRYGTLPIGIIDFNTYLQLKNAAPELVGQWELAPYPGTVDDEGNVNRSYIANGFGGVILENSNRTEDSWEFLKWWLSTETQTQYAYNLQSTYGPEYVWLSGNKNALRNAPIDEDDKKVMLEQIEWLRDVPRTPGQYMLERSLSDIWNTQVFDGTPTRVAIDRYTIIINREIRRKLIEFGYLDKNGNVLKEYKIRDIDWIKEQIRSNGGMK